MHGDLHGSPAVFCQRVIARRGDIASEVCLSDETRHPSWLEDHPIRTILPTSVRAIRFVYIDLFRLTRFLVD